MSDICLKETARADGNHVLLPFALQEKGLGDEVKGNRRVDMETAEHLNRKPLNYFYNTLQVWQTYKEVES
jgi:hypothetical protein